MITYFQQDFIVLKVLHWKINALLAMYDRNTERILHPRCQATLPSQTRMTNIHFLNQILAHISFFKLAGHFRSTKALSYLQIYQLQSNLKSFGIRLLQNYVIKA